MYLIKGHIIRLLYLCPFHFFFTVLILLNILYSCLLSGKIKNTNTNDYCVAIDTQPVSKILVPSLREVSREINVLI